MKKINLMQITGALVLLACVVFALARLDSAESRVKPWLPCVGAGVVLTVLGIFLPAKKRGIPMNKLLHPVFFLIATVCVIPTAAETEPAASQPTDVQAVLAANAALTAASNRLDTDAFFAGIVDSDETRIIQDGKLFQTRAEAMAAVRQGSQGVAKLERRFEDPHVTVLAPGAALLTAGGTTAVTLQDGRTFNNRFAVSLLFVLRDGRWKVLHGHYSQPDPAR